ncbi:MAG: DUF4136 domain-containing protein [Acidobacteriia bacterium]|nr:DUF4136 domain-containing protein [Terriglobia bacterium]
MKKQFAAMLVAALLGICAVLFADVKTDYSHSTDFMKYKTYSWVKLQAGNGLWQDRIRKNVDAALQAKGWQVSPSGGDVGVTAFGSTENQKTLQTFYDNLGGGWFWGGMDGMATTTVENTPVGTLVVDLFDTHSKKLVWRGVATNTLSGDPDKNAKKLHDTVEDMFKHFPPKPKG